MIWIQFQFQDNESSSGFVGEDEAEVGQNLIVHDLSCLPVSV